jgi:tetratricopeptide (TPR) repeat protein
MIKKSSIALAAFLLVVGSASLSVSSPSFAQAADAKDKAKLEVIRAEWSKPWTEIQKLIGDKQFPEAMEKLNALSLFENKTPYETFFLSRTKAVVASSTANTPLLMTCFEEMINSGFLSQDEKLKYMEAMAGTYFNDKKYKEAQIWTERYLELSKDAVVMQDLLVRALYLQDDYVGSVRELKKQIQGDLDAKRIPSHDRLRLLHGSEMKLKNVDGSTKALEMLVTYHPKKEYWADLLYRLPNKQGFSDRLRLDWYRLMFRTENLEDASQYQEMAELSLLAGLPAEAKNVMEVGYKVNMLGVGKNAAKHKPILDKAIKQAADDAKTLDAGEAAAKAAKTGLAMVNMGYNFATLGQFEKGIPLIEQGIAKGGLKAPEEAKLHLGMAYLQAGNRAKAEEVLKTVQGNDGAVEIARYWLLVK